MKNFWIDKKQDKVADILTVELRARFHREMHAETKKYVESLEKSFKRMINK